MKTEVLQSLNPLDNSEFTIFYEEPVTLYVHKTVAPPSECLIINRVPTVSSDAIFNSLGFKNIAAVGKIILSQNTAFNFDRIFNLLNIHFPELSAFHNEENLNETKKKTEPEKTLIFSEELWILVDDLFISFYLNTQLPSPILLWVAGTLTGTVSERSLEIIQTIQDILKSYENKLL